MSGGGGHGQLAARAVSVGGGHGQLAGCQGRSARTASSPPLSGLLACRYKGLVATMISGAPYTGIQMTTYELMQVRGGHGQLAAGCQGRSSLDVRAHAGAWGA